MKNDLCEIKDADGKWCERTLADAKVLPKGTQKRCPLCWGAVYIYPSPEQFEHVVAHTGCPRSKYNYSGAASLHPQAIQ